MDDVVGRAAIQQVPPDRKAESDGRTERAPAVAVDTARIGQTDDVDSGQIGSTTFVPVAHRQVGDLVAGGGEPQREVTEPALGTADGLRVDVVVDEADAHRSDPSVARGAGVEPG